MPVPSDRSAAQAPTDVILTVDTAFAVPSMPFAPVGPRLVTCPVDGQSEGLSFLLDLLGWYDLTATFFVETGQIRRFGDAPMGWVAERIHETEQDVQLLIDPRWAGSDTPDRDTYDTLVDEGLAVLVGWGVPRPVAVRRYDGRADATLIAAAAARGLPLTSSNGDAAMSGDLDGGPRSNGTATDLPVLRYRHRSLWRRHPLPRSVTAAGLSWPAMQALLWRARSTGLSPVVIALTIWDFVTGDYRGTLKSNGRAQYRMERLGEFIRDQADDFRSIGLGQVSGFPPATV